MTEQKVVRTLSPGVPYPKPEKKKKGDKKDTASNDDK